MKDKKEMWREKEKKKTPTTTIRAIAIDLADARIGLVARSLAETICVNLKLKRKRAQCFDF